MPLRGNKTFSLVKSKKGAEDACILQTIRPIDDSEVFPSATLSRVTATSPTAKNRERSFSLTSPAQLNWNNSLSPAVVDYNSNPSLNFKGSIHHPELNGLSEEAVELLHDSNALNKQPIQPTVLKPLHIHPNKLEDISQGKTKSSSHTRSYSTITGPILNDTTSKPPGPLPNYNSNRFPSLEKQQQALLLLADKQALLKSTILDSEIDKNYHTITASNSRELLKEFNSRSRPSNAGSKMAGKIQRTIRALYDGGSEKKITIERMDGDKSTEATDRMKLSKTASLGLQVEHSSPKQDKRSAKRSRSPKPSRRGNVPMKDMDGSRRFKWRGSVNRIVKKFGQGQSLLQGATFDVLLEDCPPSESNELIPFIVDLCCRLVEQHGLAFTGIYRVPGNTGTLQALQDELNQRGPDAVDLENDERFCDLNVVSSLLKSFFRKLPDPLFTNELYDDFIAVNRRSDPEQRLSGLRRLVHMLPPPHYETLKYLITHLRKVSDNSEVNKMEIRNLAIVFGPTLVKNTATDNMATMVTDMSDQCRIVESVLQHASWFFCEDEERAKLLIPSLPPPRIQQNEPNLDHLLANVGRTTDDVSDTASESSKSKISLVSEKESFSRDVMDSIFGPGKQWLENPSDGGKDFGAKRCSDDEEFDLDPSQKRELPHNNSHSDVSRITHPPSNAQQMLIGRQVMPGTKTNRPLSKEYLPLDYNSRLREFFVENMEWLGRIDINRSFPHLSSSSAESSPQVTPRTSVLGLPQPAVQRTYPRQHSRRLSDGKLSSQSVSPRAEYSRQISTPLSSPHLQRNNRSQKDATSKTVPAGFWPTGTVFRDLWDNQPRSVLSSRSRSEVSSRESLMADVESDSDTSIFIGETLEEKLRNLTNLNNKLERRSARRQGNGECLNLKHPTASTSIKTLKKNIVAANGTGMDSFENLSFSKKSSQELYQERKAQRQQHRGITKNQRANRKDCIDLSRCISDENVYALTDPIRQGARTDADVHTSALRKQLFADKSKRRHTLGSGDFPDPSFWESSQSVSLQNITRDIHDMTLSRLRPQLRASAPSLFPQTPNTRLLWYGVPNPRPDWTRKPETHI